MVLGEKRIWAVVRRGLYPVLLLVAVCGTWAVMLTGAEPMIAVTLVVVSMAIVVWGLELWRPYQRSWRPPGRTIALDVVHTIVSSQVVSPLVKMGLALAVVELVRPHFGFILWPEHWPLGLQVLLAIPIADFGIYMGHRLMHVTDIGWRVHAVHHSPRRLHFWASARSHPFNVVVKMVAETGVLLLLGMPIEAYSLWLVFMSVNGLLQHSNIDLRTGWLSRVLATCEVHRVHHSRIRELSDGNYGNTTVIWDQVFGTYNMPPEPVTEVGAAGYRIPENYVQHLLAPFVLPRFEERLETDP